MNESRISFPTTLVPPIQVEIVEVGIDEQSVDVPPLEMKQVVDSPVP